MNANATIATANSSMVSSVCRRPLIDDWRRSGDAHELPDGMVEGRTYAAAVAHWKLGLSVGCGPGFPFTLDAGFLSVFAFAFAAWYATFAVCQFCSFLNQFWHWSTWLLTSATVCCAWARLLAVIVAASCDW